MKNILGQLQGSSWDLSWANDGSVVIVDFGNLKSNEIGFTSLWGFSINSLD